ncbi:alpha/beta hydrolase-fold protein [Stenotrophomonas sp. 24(2023)]|uniref:alpha/beta hydrolase n=1 Tax=Stenotrophomonas sp. 24(2023) TaxID=3068324 RepID=UPI0027DF2CE3|nr:alpha/beta hydrolase-fold protein [Stenotrophomonas sp. 24(2023)]WMJ70229.1 alpha/beta hydrolase-fold protein [Stenotrophomonas sp. 24(2023)]
MRLPLLPLLLLPVLATAAPAAPAATTTTAVAAPAATPLVIGQTFTVASKVLGETRRINVYRPQPWGLAADAPLPVLYMPDGGTAEDFLHVAGLVQVLSANGSMRPFLLVGIENTERRRDMTGPTDDPEDRRIAPRVGGAAAYRRFLRDELMPQVQQRYPITEERAIIGESLAGLFVLDTLLHEPGLFQSYIALDPSLWWNRGRALAELGEAAPAIARVHPQVFIASSGQPELARAAGQFVAGLRADAPAVAVNHLALPQETHATIYHPAALQALRTLFVPADAGTH